MGIAIFTDERGSGALMYVSEADNPTWALEEFDASVGIDPHDEGLEAIADRFIFFAIPNEDMPAWRDAEAFDFPPTDGLIRLA